MKFLTEYKKSLKMFETEEIFDILIFRPLGYIVMKIFYYTPATPNFISLISMLLGIATGILFAQAESVYLAYGALTLTLANVFDCADGQLARAKGNGTKFGRFFDGFIDYINYICIYVAMAYHLFTTTAHHSEYMWSFGEHYWLWWIFVAIAGASTSWQALLVDSARNEFKNCTDGSDRDFLEKEYDISLKEYEDIKKKSGKLRLKFIYKIYLNYMRVQLKTAGASSVGIDKDVYYKKNKFIMRLWGIAGSTSHLLLVSICALFHRFDIYVWAIIVPYNVFSITLKLIQKFVNKKAKSIEGTS